MAEALCPRDESRSAAGAVSNGYAAHLIDVDKNPKEVKHRHAENKQCRCKVHGQQAYRQHHQEKRKEQRAIIVKPFKHPHRCKTTAKGQEYAPGNHLSGPVSVQSGGFGGELSAIIAEKAIEYMEGPIVRVAGFDTPFPYALEHLYMPDPKRVAAGIEKTFVW